MWFKNLIVYRFTQPFALAPQQLEQKLNEHRFKPCAAQELSRYGWVPPMGKLSDQLAHVGNGCLLITAQLQEKILPASVVKRLLAEKVEQIEQEQDRKVRKKERDALRDDLVIELAGQAFTRETLTYAYIDPARGLLLVDASSAKRADELTSYLRKTLGSLPISLPSLNRAPASVMTCWLQEEETLPQGFDLGDEGELRDPSEGGAKARLNSQEMRSDEIGGHLEAGKQVVKLGLEWREQISFVLGEDLILRKLKFADRLQERAAEMGEADAAAAFDADFLLMTGELGRLIPELLTELGGEALELVQETDGA